MARVSVLFDDDVVVVDGKPAHFPHGEVQPENQNFTAIQWYGEENYGVIEVKLGERIWFEDPKIVQPYIDQHTPRFAQLEQERIEREEKAAKIAAEAEQSIAKAEAANQNLEAAASEEPTS